MRLRTSIVGLVCAVAVGAARVLFASTPVDVPVRVTLGGAPVPNAVVWFEVPGAPRSARTVTLDQRNLAFEPDLLVVPVGSTVEFPNNDRVLHNVFSFKDGKPFDLGLYPVGQTRRVVFDRPGVSRLFCNIHPGMTAYIVVVDSAYSGVSDRDGRLVLRGVPAGSGSLRAWRPGADVLSSTTTVAAGLPLEIRWPVP
ncbi:MAG: plastocyanin/azurin family copper-binding protein [Vicinamibacterales bacterium]